MSEIGRAEIKNHIYYPQIKDDKGIFNDNAFYDSDAVRRYDTLSKPKLWHILASLLGYALILFSVQLVPWGVQYLHFSSEMEFGKLLVYCLPVPILIAFAIILRS